MNIKIEKKDDKVILGCYIDIGTYRDDLADYPSIVKVIDSNLTKFRRKIHYFFLDSSGKFLHDYEHSAVYVTLHDYNYDIIPPFNFGTTLSLDIYAYEGKVIPHTFIPLLFGKEFSSNSERDPDKFFSVLSMAIGDLDIAAQDLFLFTGFFAKFYANLNYALIDIFTVPRNAYVEEVLSNSMVWAIARSAPSSIVELFEDVLSYEFIACHSSCSLEQMTLSVRYSLILLSFNLKNRIPSDMFRYRFIEPTLEYLNSSLNGRPDEGVIFGKIENDYMEEIRESINNHSEVYSAYPNILNIAKETLEYLSNHPGNIIERNFEKSLKPDFSALSALDDMRSMLEVEHGDSWSLKKSQFDEVQLAPYEPELIEESSPRFELTHDNLSSNKFLFHLGLGKAGDFKFGPGQHMLAENLEEAAERIAAGDMVNHVTIGIPGFSNSWALIREVTCGGKKNLVVEQIQTDYASTLAQFYWIGKPSPKNDEEREEFEKAKGRRNAREKQYGDEFYYGIAHMLLIAKVYPFLVLRNLIEYLDKSGEFEYFYIGKYTVENASVKNESKLKYIYEDIPAMLSSEKESICNLQLYKIYADKDTYSKINKKISEITGLSEQYNYSKTPIENGIKYGSPEFNKILNIISLPVSPPKKDRIQNIVSPEQISSAINSARNIIENEIGITIPDDSYSSPLLLIKELNLSIIPAVKGSKEKKDMVMNLIRELSKVRTAYRINMIKKIAGSLRKNRLNKIKKIAGI